MKKLSPETIEKLEWLKGRLRKYPHRYDQGEWCGTQGCLAGFCLPKVTGVRSILLSKKKSDLFFGNGNFARVRGAAAAFLGIGQDEASILFAGYWNEEAQQFNRDPTDTDEQAAEKACQRIDLFIESGGTQ